MTREQSLKHLQNVSWTLYNHASSKGIGVYYLKDRTIGNLLSYVKCDNGGTKYNAACNPLSPVAEELIKLKQQIDTLS